MGNYPNPFYYSNTMDATVEDLLDDVNELHDDIHGYGLTADERRVRYPDSFEGSQSSTTSDPNGASSTDQTTEPETSDTTEETIPPITTPITGSTVVTGNHNVHLDCYPYSFSPLLLFAPDRYFDKGYSNYAAVARFFSSAIGTHMNANEHNVVYERRNLPYDELLGYVVTNRCLVVCCIDAHFTAFQILPHTNRSASNDRKRASSSTSSISPFSVLYYDPAGGSLRLLTGDSARKFTLFRLLKCHYGDDQHIIDHPDHYRNTTDTVRNTIGAMWKRINKMEDVPVSSRPVGLDLTTYVFVNDPNDPSKMSRQLTSCTCYFQVFLFGVLCEVGKIEAPTDGNRVVVRDEKALGVVGERMCRYLLEFFAAKEEEEEDRSGVVGDNRGSMEEEEEQPRQRLLLRPMTNNNFVLDFYGFLSSPYYKKATDYLKRCHTKRVTASTTNTNTNTTDSYNYEHQYHRVLHYYRQTKCLHPYDKFSLAGTTESTPNTKTLTAVLATDRAALKLASSDYYKHCAANLMFGFHAGIIADLNDFYEFNSLRKNQLLRFYDRIKMVLGEDGLEDVVRTARYRDYYFMGQYEVGQQELIDVHHYTLLVDHCALGKTETDALSRVQGVNRLLRKHAFFSTNNRYDYEKIRTTEDDRFFGSKREQKEFLDRFMTTGFFAGSIGLGFTDFNPKEKEVNSMTQTVFYDVGFMRKQQFRREHEFEKECLNQMARTNLSKYSQTVDGDLNGDNKYRIWVKIGFGYTYSKYNTLMHFLNVVRSYWNNPDLSNVSLFGKDVRSLLVFSSQKIFFDKDHCGSYHYGPFESISQEGYYSARISLDLAVASPSWHAAAGVSRRKKNGINHLIVTDATYEYNYIQGILRTTFEEMGDVSIQTDDEVVNLCLLSLMLDFGLFERYGGLLHSSLPLLKDLQHQSDTRELQVEVANDIYEFDRRNASNAVTRAKVEELLFEMSHKFLVNKNFNVKSAQFRLIRELNSDPDYQRYVILVKIYMSLCQINKSVEVDYYKVKINNEFRIVIPTNFSKDTGAYLEETTKHYTFSERDGIMTYDDMPVFDLRPHQPEINLYRVRLDPATDKQSMVKYIEATNVFRILDDSKEQYLIFIANNTLALDVVDQTGMVISVNSIPVEVATVFFNDAVSFVPCFQYTDTEDVVLFTSPQLKFHVDSGGQYCTDYYGMRHELIEYISSEEIVEDLNDETGFRLFKLSELLTESKTVFYYPDYLLQTPDRSQIINLLDLALKLRNVSFFILVLIYLKRSSVKLEFKEYEGNTRYISGPWKEAILYVLCRSKNPHYDSIIQTQFFDLKQHKNLPIDDFIGILCKNFTRYQRFSDGQCLIVPTEKQKSFLKKIICSEECFHFSEVGSGKTKVILPLLCQAFLSNNEEVHRNLCRGGRTKDVLVVLVPEHLVSDARIQVFRYCLNLNFKEEYFVYDNIFALLNKNVKLVSGSQCKHIFVTSFNQFKKALTYDAICRKVMPHREHFLVVADEVDDFLDRNKLVFNICSNTNNAFTRDILDLFFEVSRAAYSDSGFPSSKLQSTPNPVYWKQLFDKFRAIHKEIQDASRSINKSFGIFNEDTLRHCKTNVSQDIEGYKSLIARPYESVNRAMPGSYYSDVERTIYLTYVILTEDISKYNDLFQGERKFITFEYWNEHFAHQLDFDDLVYGHDSLSEICEKHPETNDGLAKFLYEIILRRMEIRDKSRSVNSIDIIFNFDCIGFTGTPFLDNYPTADYIRHERSDDIPTMINRDFYAYTSDELSQTEFEARFESFQGQNNDVQIRYVSSDFIRSSTNEMETLGVIFEREERTKVSISSMTIEDRNTDCEPMSFNAIVDLCGIFKRSTIQDICSYIRQFYGPDKFHYLYHIDQSDNSDRVLCIKTGNDVQYDEEFYKRLCKMYGETVPDHIFFFVDNRNVIGKDIPFQLVYQSQYGKALFMKSIIIAHDVDDFSKIWQAMGRSRTMNNTYFTIYKSNIPEGMNCDRALAQNIRNLELTKLLYVTNCDRKMAGNISSTYLTLIALFNLSEESFYHRDSIVNTFIEKMDMTITKSVSSLEKQLVHNILGTPVLSHILQNILTDKFKRSPNKTVSGFSHRGLADDVLEKILRQVVKEKFEQHVPTTDNLGQLIIFLSGEQVSLMEISYTKQQQKQRQRQQNKNHDSDAMGIFDERHQLSLSFIMPDYFNETRTSQNDKIKRVLTQPISVPILKIAYRVGTRNGVINVYPTLQFLYSHHIKQEYITEEVREEAADLKESNSFKKFLTRVEEINHKCHSDDLTGGLSESCEQYTIDVDINFVRQSPQYTIAALREGVYVLGMKDQFNIHNLETNSMKNSIKYVMDDLGFVLFDQTETRNIDIFGPYFIEQYIIMDVLSKQEVAQNVLDYYCENRDTIQRGLNTYTEKQGKGFVCWRFLINETAKAIAKEAKNNSNSSCGMSKDKTEILTSGSKRRRSDRHSPNCGSKVPVIHNQAAFR